jgi:hypothetical protein
METSEALRERVRDRFEALGPIELRYHGGGVNERSTDIGTQRPV